MARPLTMSFPYFPNAPNSPFSSYPVVTPIYIHNYPNFDPANRAIQPLPYPVVMGSPFYSSGFVTLGPPEFQLVPIGSFGTNYRLM